MLIYKEIRGMGTIPIHYKEKMGYKCASQYTFTLLREIQQTNATTGKSNKTVQGSRMHATHLHLSLYPPSRQGRRVK